MATPCEVFHCTSLYFETHVHIYISVSTELCHSMSAVECIGDAACAWFLSSFLSAVAAAAAAHTDCHLAHFDRVTLDTPMNRKFMPKADFSSWTPLEYVSE